jgi:hypothetical protein
MDLGQIMQAVADELVSASVVANAYGYPAKSITPPCAIVGYPEEIEFDMTFQDGSHKLDLPVWIFVGTVHDRSARDRMSDLISGVSGVKEALDGTLTAAVQTCRVVDCRIEMITIAGVDYLSAKFSLEIYS